MLEQIGQRVGSTDRVVVDGRDVTKRLAGEQATRVILYHKPSGEMLRARVGDDRAGVEARLPSLRSGRWVPVNALGFGEEGLLVLTSLLIGGLDLLRVGGLTVLPVVTALLGALALAYGATLLSYEAGISASTTREEMTFLSDLSRHYADLYDEK